MPYLTVDDGAELFYTDDGDRQPMILVHGWTCDSMDWSWVIPDLRDDFRVIAYDRRGEGRSSQASSYTLARQVQDLAYVIRELRCDAPILVGHSLGGAIVSSLSVEHPGLAKAIVVLDPPYAADATAAAASEAMIAPLSGPAYADALKGFWDAICYRPASPEWLRTMNMRRIDALSQESLLQTYLGMWEAPSGLARRPQSDAYLRLRAEPVLAIYSSQPAEHERSLFMDARSRAIEWPGTGHWLQVERPRELVTVMREWLSELDT